MATTPLLRCLRCGGLVYDATDCREPGVRQFSCLICGELTFEPPPPLRPIPPARRGRPRKVVV